MDAGYLVFSVFFSVIGLAYFSYGRRQNLYFMLSGIFLMVYPYGVSTLTWLIIVGILLMILPFLLNRFIAL